MIDLFGNKAIKKKSREAQFTDYDAFVEKFKPKKTTDDCYTPPAVYDAVLKFVGERCDIAGCDIVRPFYPGGDYERLEYGPNCVVIDNPPFSIVSQIAKFYIGRGVKFFIFAPHMTLFSSDMDCTGVVCGASVIYENGADVKTSFLSNLFGDIRVLGAPSLYAVLKAINKSSVELPKYQYPNNVLTVSAVQKLVERGIDFSVGKCHVRHVRQLDSQTKHKKAVFGSGFLLSEKAAAEKAAAEKAAAEKAAAERVNRMSWELSNREKKIIAELG